MPTKTKKKPWKIKNNEFPPQSEHLVTGILPIFLWILHIWAIKRTLCVRCASSGNCGCEAVSPVCMWCGRPPQPAEQWSRIRKQTTGKHKAAKPYETQDLMAWNCFNDIVRALCGFWFSACFPVMLFKMACHHVNIRVSGLVCMTQLNNTSTSANRTRSSTILN